MRTVSQFSRWGEGERMIFSSTACQCLKDIRAYGGEDGKKLACGERCFYLFLVSESFLKCERMAGNVGLKHKGFNQFKPFKANGGVHLGNSETSKR